MVALVGVVGAVGVVALVGAVGVVGVVDDEGGEDVVDGLPQGADVVQGAGRSGGVGVGEAPEVGEGGGGEVAGEGGPFQQAGVAVEPVDGVRVAGRDGVHKVDDDMAADEVTGLEGVGLEGVGLNDSRHACPPSMACLPSSNRCTDVIRLDWRV
ncbi:hypothetical protein AB6O49_34130 [Streptomyces sp. SBR177]